MDCSLWNQEILISHNTGGMREELLLAFSEYTNPYFVIRYTDGEGWRREKNFYETKSAMAAWEELKRNYDNTKGN